MSKGKILVGDRLDKPFLNRTEAGVRLGQTLKGLVLGSVVVLGIPRGGVLVAQAVAPELGAEVDVVLSRKIGVPGNPEFALGAVSEDGQMVINKKYLTQAGVDEEYIEIERDRQFLEIKRRTDIFRKICPKIPLKGRVAVVVDDGVATGATFEAAVLTIRQEKPSFLVAGIPVGSEETLLRLSNYVDQVVCLRVPGSFFALSQFYMSFPQIEDEEILRVLRTCRNQHPAL